MKAKKQTAKKKTPTGTPTKKPSFKKSYTPPVKGVGVQHGSIIDRLPTQPQRHATEFFRDTITIYGTPGVGKTRLAHEFGTCLIGDAEHGTDPYEMLSLHMNTWDDVLATLTLLEKGDHGYTTFAADPIERYYRMCEDWVVANKLGGVHPGEANDRGKSWKVLRDQFEKFFDRVRAAGLGLVCLSHVRDAEIARPGEDSYDAIRPDCTPASWSTIHSRSSYVWFYGQDIHTNQRVLWLAGPAWMITKGRVDDDHFHTPDGRVIEAVDGGKSHADAFQNLMNAYNNKTTIVRPVQRTAPVKKVVKKSAG